MSLAAAGNARADTFDDPEVAYQNGKKVEAFRLLKQVTKEITKRHSKFQIARAAPQW